MIDVHGADARCMVLKQSNMRCMVLKHDEVHCDEALKHVGAEALKHIGAEARCRPKILTCRCCITLPGELMNLAAIFQSR